MKSRDADLIWEAYRSLVTEMDVQSIYDWCNRQNPAQYWDDAQDLIIAAADEFNIDVDNPSELEELESIVRCAINSAQIP
jgi:tRNA A37 threonylcarbamoyladenosine dehydratase